MQIALGSDHAGFDLKQDLAVYMQTLGHTISDLGVYNNDKPADYSDYAEAVGRAVVEKHAERGIVICGSGVGASVAANKIPGVRAGLCHDSYSAHQGVEHDEMNVLVLGSRVIGILPAREIVQTFLSAEFSGEERHRRRLEKTLAPERRYLGRKPRPRKAPGKRSKS